MSKKKTPAPGATEKTPAKARDLLPPDAPAPPDATRLMAADASLEPEVETRKIGIRRVAGLDFANRFYDRANWRPAGNSRTFWTKIEADDPFKKAPARPTDAPLEIYAAQRIERTQGSLPKPQPDVARANPPPSREEVAAKPRAAAPRAEARRPRESVEPVHTPEPRPAPAPRPTRPAPPTPPPVVEAPPPTPPRPEPDQVVPAPPHRLPPRPTNPKAGPNAGRQRMPSRLPGGFTPAVPTTPPPEPTDRPSAAEIREQKLRARETGKNEPEVVKKKSLDDYKNFVQLMEIQQAAHERGEEIPTAFADVADDAPRPKPKAIVQRAKGSEENAPAPAPRPKPAEARAEPPRAPRPAAKPTPEPIDRTPPKPASKAEPAPATRPAPAGSTNLDDLFGAANEGRVRIGKRAAPKPTEGDQ